MKRTTFYHRFLLSLCYYTISIWIVSAYVGHKNHNGKIFLIPARFPFNTDKNLLWAIAYVYQIFAIFWNGTTHMTTDTFSTGLVFHAGLYANNIQNIQKFILDLNMKSITSSNTGRQNF